MKKFITLFAVAALGAALIGCGSKPEDTTTGATTGTTAASSAAPATTTGTTDTAATK
jgi:hypothetical protein